jgi:hypothetical protein
MHRANDTAVLRACSVILLCACSATNTSAKDLATNQYLIFQDFTGANDGSGVLRQPMAPPELRVALAAYVDRIDARLKTSTLVGAEGRYYGFAIGPLSLDQPDQELRDTIQTAFDVAIEKNVAVVLHFDVTHFWRNARNADGTLLSASTGALDNREWKDWSGTIADKDGWDSEPNILPPMCFECDQVKAMVDRVAATVIAPAVTAGLARLDATGKRDLFAGIIVGWEANPPPLGYHALSIKGDSSATAVADLVHDYQQVTHDYLARWVKNLSEHGVPTVRIYNHTANLTQFQIDHNPSAGLASAGPDSFWEAFGDHANGGFSVYDGSTQQGTFETIWAEAAKHAGTWAMAEGTNLNPTVPWEKYLGKVFNHGGTVADLFGGFLGPGSGPFGTATESDEAVAAYRKFLDGNTLIEDPMSP